MIFSEYHQLNDREWLLRRYVETQSAPAIAKEVGCTYPAVYRALRRFGIQSTRSFARRPARLDDPEWLAEEIQSKTLVELAEELGCSHPTVRAALRRHDIPLPTRPGRSAKQSATLRETLATRYPKGRRGPLASNWKGGRMKSGPYVLVYAPDHPRAKARGRSHVQEHILVAEEKLGRYLLPEERVHHENHVKDDNRPENLIVKTRGKHIQDHFLEARVLQKRVEYLEGLLDANGIPYDGGLV